MSVSRASARELLLRCTCKISTVPMIGATSVGRSVAATVNTDFPPGRFSFLNKINQINYNGEFTKSFTIDAKPSNSHAISWYTAKDFRA